MGKKAPTERFENILIVWMKQEERRGGLYKFFNVSHFEAWFGVRMIWDHVGRMALDETDGRKGTKGEKAGAGGVV